ncbi:MAG: response regulator transcription factor [Gammaproteobacteria bacterium]|nr:response regulator transcription factor [Gammaproteobacteria bacterium]
MPIKVALIDDQTLVREGIRSLLQLSAAVEVVAEGVDGSAALDIVEHHAPDVILMDLHMPKVSGIEAIQQLAATKNKTPVIILTTFDDHQLVLQGLQAGARGYLLKDVSLESLVAAIESVHRGETIVQPAITETLLRGLHGHDNAFDSLPEPAELTAKETEVLRLIAGGYSNKEISDVLHKSEGTIKNHVSSILSKLGVRDRTRAVLRAIEVGLI